MEWVEIVKNVGFPIAAALVCFVFIFKMWEQSKERENTYQAKTGYKNPSQNPDVKLQKENTTFKHFNVKNPF